MAPEGEHPADRLVVGMQIPVDLADPMAGVLQMIAQLLPQCPDEELRQVAAVLNAELTSRGLETTSS
jgi:hypothetical protein